MSDQSPPPKDEEKYRAPALSKGLDILELLATEAEGMTQVEIAKQLGRTTSEIFRMLMVLCARGYVEQLPEDDRYHLTTKMFEVAHRHPPVRRLTSIAGDAMQRLADRLNQSVHLGILHGGDVLVIAQVDGPDNYITSVRLGARTPVQDTALGRVLLAWMEPEARDRVLGLASSDVTAFCADLPRVRNEGYCQSPSLTIQGVINVSAPVRDFSGRVIAGVTIPYIRRLSSVSAPTVDECREQLVEMTQDISRRLGAGVPGQ